MYLVVGLGNPGTKYIHNRHNVGHIFIEYLRSKIKDLNKDPNFKFEKTNCFMNGSGKWVKKKISSVYLADQISNLVLVHDDLDIPLGKYKIQFGVGPKVHGGVNSVENELGTGDFWRVRIGVDNRKKDSRDSGDSYVLQDFDSSERVLFLEKEIFPKILVSLTEKLSSQNAETI